MNLTGYIVGILATVAILADVILIAIYGKQASISAWFITESQYHPMIAFVSGFLCGHLFWRMRQKDLPKVDK